MDTIQINETNIVTTGKSLEDATKALIMIHGRGGSAEDILSLADYLKVDGFALLAPEAPGHSWYPYSFMALPSQNEPWLSASLNTINDLVISLNKKGFTSEHIYLLGFSQGACLTLEFAARNATRYGGIVAFTGGLIGDKIYSENYDSNFNQTPIFIGTSDPDPHVPVQRVKASTEVLTKMNAIVTQKIYKNLGHTISNEEINIVNQTIFNS